MLVLGEGGGEVELEAQAVGDRPVRLGPSWAVTVRLPQNSPIVEKKLGKNPNTIGVTIGGTIVDPGRVPHTSRLSCRNRMTMRSAPRTLST